MNKSYIDKECNQYILKDEVFLIITPLDLTGPLHFKIIDNDLYIESLTTKTDSTTTKTIQAVPTSTTPTTININPPSLNAYKISNLGLKSIENIKKGNGVLTEVGGGYVFNEYIIKL